MLISGNQQDYIGEQKKKSSVTEILGIERSESFPQFTCLIVLFWIMQTQYIVIGNWNEKEIKTSDTLNWF